MAKVFLFIALGMFTLEMGIGCAFLGMWLGGNPEAVAMVNAAFK